MANLLIATLLVTVCLVSCVHSEVDFCHAEPRQRRVFPSCKPSKHLVYVAQLHSNPYHALHDWMWGVTYYLLHCTKHRDVTVIFDAQRPRNNLTQCLEHSFPDTMSQQRIVTWGACVMYILARSLDVGLEIVYNGTRAWPPTGKVDVNGIMIPGRGKSGAGANSCVYRTYLGVEKEMNVPNGLKIYYRHFRGLDWYGRECGANGEDCKGSGLVKLPEMYKDEAIRTVRDTVRSFFNVTKRRVRKPIHVLVYDRADAPQRQWANAKGLVKELEKDSRVLVRFYRRMPLTMQEQVVLYTWADIVVAPHGAAMANTVFMQGGGEILEIHSHWCDMNVGVERYRPRDWTGWHVAALGLNLRYVQCHRADRPYRKENELLVGEKGVMTRGMHKVRVSDVMKELNPVIGRMVSNGTRKAVKNIFRGNAKV